MNKQMSSRWAAMALIAGAAVSSCGGQSSSDGPRTSTSSESHGTVGLSLVPVSGVTLDSVHYTVTNGTATVSEGDLPTPGIAKEFSFGLSLPVGIGYTISLSAVSAEAGDNISCGASYGTFNVAPNTSTNFSLVLVCHDNGLGQILPAIDVKTDACPRIVFDYAIATPALAKVGSTIAVLGKARDLDGKALTYSWKLGTPTTGSFSSVNGASSTLTCNNPKSGELVTVTANNGECTKSLSTTVSCAFANCVTASNCDPALPGAVCPPICVAECSNGIVERPTEDCDPGNTANCTATCKTRTPLCNDSWLTNGEECDPSATPPVPPGTPGPKVCDATCHLRDLLNVCGNGVVEAGEECDGALPPFPSNAASATCSNTCKKISTDECVACEDAGDCFENQNNCLGVFQPFSQSEQTQCYDVMSCIQKSNCFDGTIGIGKCYCGDLGVQACVMAPFSGPGSPNGACVNELKAGFPTFTSNAAVLAGLVVTDFPSGAATKRVSCQKNANVSACSAVCGFTAGGPAFP